MTKFTKILAAVAMLWLVAVQATPLMAQQYDFQVGQLYYKITDATKRKVAVVRGNNEPTGAITIPATVVNGGNTYSVTSIGNEAFYRCTKLAAINIPNSVTSIGAVAFLSCTGLTSINIPSSVTSIGNRAFENCSGLKQATVPGDINFKDVFFVSNIERVVIAEGSTNIGKSSFSGCSNIKSITIPGSVTSIGEKAFAGCRGLTSINIPNGVTKIEYGTFSGCKGLTSIDIPNGATSIGASAFYGCKGLTSINIPNGITKIENSTFSGCEGLNSIDIPNGVTSIGAEAFYGCKGLTSINIPSGVTSIGERAFSACRGLTSINIPNSITKIEKGTFSGCEGLNSIDIPNGVTSIGAEAFRGCSGLTSIKIPSSVTSIGDDFGVYSDDIGAFSGCKGLTSIDIPSSVTIIGWYTFSGCTGLTSINIPSGVTRINHGTFSGCKGLTSINIPNNVTSIVGEAFSGCEGLKSVTVHWQTPLAIDKGVFDGITLNNVILIVPRGTKAAYRAAEVWEEFNPIVEDADYTITYSQPANGTLKVKNGTQEITSGSTIKGGTILTIEATPDPHYKLDSILINGKRSDKLNITVEENTHIEAFFGKEKYTVKYNNPYGGKLYVIKGTDIVTSGEGVEYGTELTVKTAPDAGFKLKSLILNGQTIPDNYKFAISEPVTIEVVFTSVGTGLDETSAAGTVVYPNPVVDILRIATDTPIRTIRVFNIYGREVARATDTDRIDLSHLPAGVYTVRADGKKAKVVKK